MLRTKKAVAAATAKFPSRDGAPHALFFVLVRRMFVLDSSGNGSIILSQLASRSTEVLIARGCRCVGLLDRIGTKR